MSDLDALEARIEGSYDLCHINAREVTDVIARLREAEAETVRLRAVMGRGFEKTLEDRDEAYREMHARELHHFEEEKLRAEAEAVIEVTEDWVTAHYLDTHMGEKVLELLSHRKTTKTEGSESGGR